MPTPMMKCGHAANGTHAGKPVCVICFGIDPGAEQIQEQAQPLAGRKARCTYYGHKCQSEANSNSSLPFFKIHPNRPHDEYYCGCYGWD